AFALSGWCSGSLLRSGSDGSRLPLAFLDVSLIAGTDRCGEEGKASECHRPCGRDPHANHRVPLRFRLRIPDGYLAEWHHRDHIAADLPQFACSIATVRTAAAALACDHLLAHCPQNTWGHGVFRCV